MGWRIGVDSGGTFTDVCLFDQDSGHFEIWKMPSTPDDPSRGIAEVVAEGLTRVKSELSDIKFFGHGTTVATNALIELRGAKTALLVTDGFRDLLEIGRQRRPSLYDMFADKPRTLVSRDLRLDVKERLRSDGSVEIPLDIEKVREQIRDLADDEIEAVAVCFLYSFLDGHHEALTGSELELGLNGPFISLSHEVAPEFREFERLSTTVINAFLGPIMQRYIDRLDNRLRDSGLKISPHLTQSNGGVIGFPTAAKFPVRTLLSGPSTGVVAAQEIAGLAGFNNVITFDVGGTSSDVALLENRTCKKTGEAEVHGYPIKTPMLDIHTVGAGGGSVAEVDNGGLLKVGPESAGANPGPVCYDLGGKKPTLTDANVVLEILNPDEILGGRMKIAKAKAVDAIEEIAQQIGLDLYETAQGIISVATANMAKAIRVISVQRGYDPRDYALMAFGGGGPLHAARLARELDIAKVIVPLTPGALCALGLLMTDLKADFAKSRLTELQSADPKDIREGFLELEVQAEKWFTAESIKADDRKIHRTADLRYTGQNYEISVPFPDGEITTESIAALRKEFEASHYQRYGFAPDDEPVELVTLRIEAVGLVKKATIKAQAPSVDLAPPVPSSHRRIWMPELNETVSCPIYKREQLEYGHLLEGPAVIEQMDTTTLVLPKMIAKVDAYLNLVLEDK